MVGSRPPEACLGPHCTRFRPLAAEARGSEWGRGGSGAQAHSSPSELRARASCTHRAQRARGPGRQVRPVPWRPEVRFHPGERSHPLEKARSVLPPGVLPVRGNTRLPAPILAPSSRGRSPGTRSSSAPTLETFGGALPRSAGPRGNSPETPAEGGGGTMLATKCYSGGGHLSRARSARGRTSRGRWRATGV